MAATPLFIYGTLLAVARHPMGDALRAGGHRIGSGSIQARLYVIDDPDAPGENFYPGAVPSADPRDRVFGEVWDITAPDLWARFDAFEACSADWPEPHEFMLRTIDVALNDGQVLQARSYLYTWDVTTARHIPDGRFTEASPDVR